MAELVDHVRFLYKQKQNGTQGRWLNRIDAKALIAHTDTLAFHTNSSIEKEKKNQLN